MRPASGAGRSASAVKSRIFFIRSRLRTAISRVRLGPTGDFALILRDETGSPCRWRHPPVRSATVIRVNRFFKRALPLARRYWFDALVTIGICLVTATAIVDQKGPHTGLEGPVWFDVLAGIVILVPLYFRRRFPFGAPLTTILAAGRRVLRRQPLPTRALHPPARGGLRLRPHGHGAHSCGRRSRAGWSHSPSSASPFTTTRRAKPATSSGSASS